MTTPRDVNKALKKAGLKVEIVRHSSGYYWFDDDTTQITSIYSHNLFAHTSDEIVRHVQAELKRIADGGLPPW